MLYFPNFPYYYRLSRVTSQTEKITTESFHLFTLYDSEKRLNIGIGYKTMM